MMKNWFEVDKHGLARILERKGKEFVLFELVQNAWDESGVTNVSATLEYRGRNRALLVVEDDAPEGFHDLSHAFTLFAESAKKFNPQQRGRFNFGEKLVLAISDEVTIRTTKGGIRFDAEGRHTLRTRQPVGSRIECLLRMTEDEAKTRCGFRICSTTLRTVTPNLISEAFGRRLSRGFPAGWG